MVLVIYLTRGGRIINLNAYSSPETLTIYAGDMNLSKKSLKRKTDKKRKIVSFQESFWVVSDLT